MSAPSEKEKRLCAMFDSFCKTVARNFSRNLKRAAENRRKYDGTGAEPVQYLLDVLSHEDTHPSDHLVLYADELPCVVDSETLYKALQSLSDSQRGVLLLDFWYDCTDEEISKRLGVTTRTVYNLRQRAFSKIRKFYEHHGRDP